MKIKARFNRTYINKDVMANEALFFTDEIDREIVDKIVDYLRPFDNVHNLEKYFNTEVYSNCIIITTTRGVHYLRQILDNIERITNNEPVRPIYVLYPDIKCPKFTSDTVNFKEKKEEKSTMEKNNPFIPRVKFISESKSITVSFGRGEDASYLVFREVIRYGWVGRPGLRNKKKSINTAKNHNITAVTIFVQGYDKIEYYDMVRDAFDEMAKMADLDFEFRFSDNINANSGAIVHDLAEAVHDQIEKVDCLCFSLEWKIDDLLVDGHDKDEIAEAAADLHFEVAALQEMYDHVKD